jgi:molybdopterin-guanine dinucleotide biosynthesis protein A
MLYHDITGVVLAGGRSSRMGQDKALLEWKGKPLIAHAINILGQLCEKVVISANKDDYHFTACEVWYDEWAVQAPMTGIYSSLRRSQHDWIMVLSCDMPLVDPRLFHALLSFSQGYDVVVPVHDGGFIEPLCGLYSRKALPHLEQNLQRQSYSLQQFIFSSKSRLMETGPELDFFRSDIFFNVNTKDNFDLLYTQ